jgi:hypothetical protein
MPSALIAFQRIFQQRVSHSLLVSPAEVVSWLGAVQAQDYMGAQWSLGLRMAGTTTVDRVEQGFNDGDILRTHVMRPTWHFVAPADIRWLLGLTKTRVEAKLTTMDRRMELDRPFLLKCYAIFENALRGCKQLTRAELGSALAASGIAVETEGLRLIHIVMHAELDAILCSGPRRGKQFTYMLLEERVPQAKTLSRDETLAELTRRYYTGHGPATVQDLSWWSGLTLADVKAGLALVGDALMKETIDGQTYYYSEAFHPPDAPSQAAYLLPTYDEFLVGYAGFDQTRRAGQERSTNGIYDPSLIYSGQVIGSWRRTLKKNSVVIELLPFAPTNDASQAILAAAERFGKFLGLKVEIA